MKTYLTILCLCLIGTVTAPIAGAQTPSSERILGTWVNTTSTPVRVPTFRSDGTFHVEYRGTPKVVDGTWNIKGETLYRYFPNQTMSQVEILKLTKSTMELKTDYMSPTGPKSQIDHYVRAN